MNKVLGSKTMRLLRLGNAYAEQVLKFPKIKQQPNQHTENRLPQSNQPVVQENKEN